MSKIKLWADKSDDVTISSILFTCNEFQNLWESKAAMLWTFELKACIRNQVALSTFPICLRQFSKEKLVPNFTPCSCWNMFCGTSDRKHGWKWQIAFFFFLLSLYVSRMDLAFPFPMCHYWSGMWFKLCADWTVRSVDVVASGQEILIRKQRS